MYCMYISGVFEPHPATVLWWGAGAEALTGRYCALNGDEVHPVFECAALQVLRDDMPPLFEGVHGLRCFMWQDNMVPMSIHA